MTPVTSPGGRGEGERFVLALLHVAALAVVLWTRAWSVPYAVLALMAIGVAALLAAMSPLARWALRGATLLAVLLGAAVLIELRGLRERPVDGPADDRVDGRLRTLASAVMPELQAAALRMVTASVGGSAGRRHVAVESRLPSGALGEGAGVILERGQPIAWAGPVRLPLDSLVGDAGVSRTPFYAVAWARAEQGPRVAFAFRTLDASDPASHLARPFSRVAAAVLDVPAIVVDSQPGVGVPIAVGSRALAWLRVVPDAGALDRAGREARARAVLLAAALALLVVLMAGGAESPAGRWMALGSALAALAVMPLSALSNVSPLFSAALFFSPDGGPFTANAGALAGAGAFATVGALWIMRRSTWRPPAIVALLVAVALVALGGVVLVTLASGVSLPQRGAAARDWVGWSVALFLAAVPFLLLASWATARWRASTSRAGAWLASALGVGLAAAGPLAWQADARWPLWYLVAWGLTGASAVLARRRRGAVWHVGLLAACASATALWASVTRQRAELAVRDVAGLATVDDETPSLLERLVRRAERMQPRGTRADLLRLYVGSELAAAGNPAELAIWDNAGDTDAPAAELVVAQLARRAEGERSVVREALQVRAPILREYASRQGIQLVLAAPLDSGRVLSAVVAPRSQLIGDDPFAALLGLEVPSVVEPPYRLTLAPAAEGRATTTPSWQRREDEVHGDWLVDSALGSLGAHVEVELRSLDVVLARGGLLLLVDLALLVALWWVASGGDRSARRWLAARARRWAASYRARLTLTLFMAFALPSAAFGAWTLERLRIEDLTSRALLVQETLRAVRLSGPEALAAEAERLQTPLFWYDGGELTATADPLHLDLAPLGYLMDPVAADEVVFGREAVANRRVTLGVVPTVVGYRVMGGGAILAAPARRTELTLERQRNDVLALLLATMAVGAMIAWGLSGLAARAFALPIGALRRAADDVARGARDLPALARHPASEFGPVYARFRQMAVELGDSRDALDAARRRTEAVLRDVASGVIAVDGAGRVVLANPRAEEILGRSVVPGSPLADIVGGEVATRVESLSRASDGDHAFDLPHRSRQVRGRVTRLSRGDGGAVLTLDDVTDLARAQRVFAWAEMARQVAHEIKNPLTPIRLGVQHLRRAHADQRPDFPAILDRNVDRVLAEIDRLDEIARSFSKFGLRPGDAVAAEDVVLAPLVHDVVALERLGEAPVQWVVEVPADVTVRARDGELREVLLNLFENARLAHAATIEVRGFDDGATVRVLVDDDGDGVPEELLSRVFEPRFSTRTSGSGLGLAISKRLVESWGGRIQLERRPMRGTRVIVTLERVPTE